MQSLRQFKFWSNTFFLIPIGVAISQELYWYSIILGCMCVVSFLFHFYSEQKFEKLDVVLSILLMMANVVLLVLSDFSLPYTFFAVVTATLALGIYFYQKSTSKKYPLYHSVWHILSALTCLFCVVTV
jgi:hypothetical protein